MQERMINRDVFIGNMVNFVILIIIYVCVKVSQL